MQAHAFVVVDELRNRDRVVLQHLLRDIGDAVEHFTYVEHAGKRLQQPVEHLEIRGALAQGGGAAAFLGHPMVRQRERHVLGDAPRDGDIKRRVLVRLVAHEVDAADEAIAESNRNAQRRPVSRAAGVGVAFQRVG